MEVSTIMHKKFITVDASARLSQVTGQLETHKDKTVLVFDGQKYVGVLGRRLLLKGRSDLLEQPVRKFVLRSPQLDADMDLMAVAKLMHSTNVLALPIVENDKVKGVVTALDVLKELVRIEQLKDITVADHSLLKPKPLKEQDTVGHSVAVMLSDKVDQSLVFNGKQLLGRVSIRDVLRVLLTPNDRISAPSKGGMKSQSRGAVVEKNRLSDLPVQSFYSSSNYETVSRDDSLKKAVTKMTKGLLHDVIVQEDDKVYGLLSLQSILARICALSQEETVTVEFPAFSKTSLGAKDQEQLEAVVRTEVAKIQRRMNKNFAVKVHIKESHSGGKAHQYHVKVKLQCPGIIATGEHEHWKVETALRKCFDHIRTAVLAKAR